jgi:DNA-directed RNA polymerase subunit RPC12/RpoP
VTTRFRDGGESLWTFGDEVLVRCPSCEGRALVRPDARDPRGAATLTCTGCGHARRTPEPVKEPRDQRCPRCDRWIPAVRWKDLDEGPRSRHEARCPRCNNVVRARIERWSTVTGLPVDPFFRAPLWLQAPCCGELLWAWNVRHLDLLSALVGASLRERTAGRSGNGTLLSRLPRWMKAARNREAVLATLAEVRARAHGGAP